MGTSVRGKTWTSPHKLTTLHNELRRFMDAIELEEHARKNLRTGDPRQVAQALLEERRRELLAQCRQTGEEVRRRREGRRVAHIELALAKCCSECTFSSLFVAPLLSTSVVPKVLELAFQEW